MTGVGGRPEVVIEIADARGDWKEVEFLYKEKFTILNPKIPMKRMCLVLSTLKIDHNLK